jgi:uncharacterized protein (TIGR02217 family)
MADAADIFPILDGMNFFSDKSPFFPDTIVRTSATGRELRISLSDIVRWKFKVGYDYLRSDTTDKDLEKIFGFFCSRIGRFKEFHFLDPTDHTVSADEFGIGDGTTTVFQLSRTVGAGSSYEFVEPIYSLSGSPVIKIDDLETEAFSVGSYGSITFDSAPPSGKVLTWSGQFMFLCHFSDDKMTAQQMTEALWSMDGLEFESWCPS